MEKYKHRFIALIICILFSVSMIIIPSSASEVDTVRDQISKLESQINDKKDEIASIRNDKANQQQLKKLYEEQLNLYQEQINICNESIRQTNDRIAQNEADIITKENEMEDAILEFKKRINAIYMGGSTGSGLEILLGAENFADFLALSQLSLNLSKRDQQLMDDITAMIEEINIKRDENLKLLEEQNDYKSILDKKYSEFDALVDKVKDKISDLSSDENNAKNEQQRLEDDLEAKERYLYQLLHPDEVVTDVFNGSFIWPVPGYYGTTSDYGNRWGTFHKGMDIASSGIRDKAIVATAPGKVIQVYSWCNHNYGKSSSCYDSNGNRCGGGYGNFVLISHGKANGVYYQTLSAHMSKTNVKVGQYVKQGDVIGYVGSTGYSTGWHLHFEVHKSTNGTSFNHTNPAPYIKK